jgi:hypothetical protein
MSTLPPPFIIEKELEKLRRKKEEPVQVPLQLPVPEPPPPEPQKPPNPDGGDSAEISDPKKDDESDADTVISFF